MFTQAVELVILSQDGDEMIPYSKIAGIRKISNCTNECPNYGELKVYINHPNYFNTTVYEGDKIDEVFDELKRCINNGYSGVFDISKYYPLEKTDEQEKESVDDVELDY